MPETENSFARRATTIARLARSPHMADFGICAAKTVIAFRLVALCVQHDHDPIGVLASRLNSITSAKAMLAFIDSCGASWPGNISVQRPCCAMLSPDETVIAGMAHAASSGDRKGFESVVSGYIIRKRYDALFACAVSLVATLD